MNVGSPIQVHPRFIHQTGWIAGESRRGLRTVRAQFEQVCLSWNIRLPFLRNPLRSCDSWASSLASSLVSGIEIQLDPLYSLFRTERRFSTLHKTTLASRSLVNKSIISTSIYFRRKCVRNFLMCSSEWTHRPIVFTLFSSYGPMRLSLGLLMPVNLESQQVYSVQER